MSIFVISKKSMEDDSLGGNVEDEDVVSYANELLSRCNIEFNVQSSAECTSDLFLAFYHAILGDFPPGTLTECNSVDAQIHNMKCIIETLSEDYLKVDLSHIVPEDIVKGDLLSLYNLTEIFDGLLDYLLERIGRESSDSGDEGDIDSDQLSETAKALAMETIQKEIAKQNGSGVEQSLSSTAELIALGKSEDDVTLPKETFIIPSESSVISQEDSLSDHTLNASSELSPQEPVRTDFSGIPSDADSYKSLPEEISGISSTLSKLRISTHQDSSASMREKSIPVEMEKSRPLTPSSSSSVISDSSGSVDSVKQKQALDVELDDKDSSFVLKKKERQKSRPDSSASESVDVADGGGGRRDVDERRPRDARSQGPPTPKEKDWQAMLDNLQRTVEESKKIREEYFSSSRLRSEPTASSDDFLSRSADETGTTGDTLDDSLEDLRRRRKNVRFEDTISTKTAKELQQFRQLLRQDRELQEEKNKILSQNFQDHLDEVQLNEGQKLDPLRRKVTQSEKKVKDTLRQQKKPKGKPRSTHKANLTDTAKWKSWLSPSKVNQRRQPLRSIQPTPKRSEPPSIGSGIESINEYDLLPKLLEEFPQLELPAATLNDMWQKQFRQIEHLTKASLDHKNKKRKGEMQLHEAHIRHELLTNIMQKDHEHTRHLRDVRERVAKQKEAQRILRDRRLQTARVRKYYKDYHLQMRSRMMKRRTKEERIFKRLFEDGLDIQRTRLRELRKYARDKREEQQKRQMNEIHSLENYYKDQFNILAETLAKERSDLKIRDAGQSKLIRQMKHGLRQKMEKEIENLQEMITRDDEDAYFREIEADRLRRQLQLATYHAKFQE